MFPFAGFCLVLLALLKLLSLLGVQRAGNWYLKLKSKLFWNFFLRIAMESYLQMHLSSTIHFTNFGVRSFSGDWIGAITSIFVAFVINLLPFGLLIFLHVKFA